MSSVLPTTPTQAGFTAFIRNVMGIPTSALPDSSPTITWALEIAQTIVNVQLNLVPGIYTLAVYNLAGDNLVNYATDQPNQTHFADLRSQLGLSNFTAGVVSSTSDSGTSVSLATPEFMKTLTLSDLQNLKTPWGRNYLAFAQRYGTAWGIS